MKKILLTLAVLLGAVVGANALTLKDAFEKIKTLPDLNGVVSDNKTDIREGWAGAIPFEDVSFTIKAHQVGNDQTVFYGTNIAELMSRLPENQLLLHGSNQQNLIYIYAQPVEGTDVSEVLMVIDQAYQGRTIALLGKVANQTVKFLSHGNISFPDEHTAVISAPVLVCD